jgi:uncharacterized membrane protein (Fun14 family)
MIRVGVIVFALGFVFDLVVKIAVLICVMVVGVFHNFCLWLLEHGICNCPRRLRVDVNSLGHWRSAVLINLAGMERMRLVISGAFGSE